MDAGVKLEASETWVVLFPPVFLCALSGQLCLEAPGGKVIQEDNKEEGPPGQGNNICKYAEV